MEAKFVSRKQPKPYADTLERWEIADAGTATEDEVLAVFQSKRSCENRAPRASSADGHCGFPFGLNSFFRISKRADGVWEYVVVDPYCD